MSRQMTYEDFQRLPEFVRFQTLHEEMLYLTEGESLIREIATSDPSVGIMYVDKNLIRLL